MFLKGLIVGFIFIFFQIVLRGCHGVSQAGNDYLPPVGFLYCLDSLLYLDILAVTAIVHKSSSVLISEFNQNYKMTRKTKMFILLSKLGPPRFLTNEFSIGLSTNFYLILMHIVSYIIAFMCSESNHNYEMKWEKTNVLSYNLNSEIVGFELMDSQLVFQQISILFICALFPT